jgi:hypothetical protein
VVMACDGEIIPLQERIATVGDEADLHESTTPSGIYFTSPRDRAARRLNSWTTSQSLGRDNCAAGASNNADLHGLATLNGVSWPEAARRLPF